jgi:hypothetical protein
MLGVQVLTGPATTGLVVEVVVQEEPEDLLHRFQMGEELVDREFRPTSLAPTCVMPLAEVEV